MGANATGLGVLSLAWIGASGQVTPRLQGGWMTAATAGLAFALLADLGAVALGRRRVRAAVLEVRHEVRWSLEGMTRDVADVRVPHWVVLDGPARYRHRPGCALIVGKPVWPLSPSDDCQVCGVCAV